MTASIRTTVGVALAIVAANTTVAQTTWYVDDDNCPGPGIGTPEDPFCSIQHAIDASSDSDAVAVHAGLYNEMVDFSGKSIALESLDGPESTTIDADNAGIAVTCAFPDSSGLAANIVLSGFTITGGAPAGSDLPGGMYIRFCNPTVIGCVFRANHGNDGGAVTISGAEPWIINCTFEQNTASDGGAIEHSSGSAARFINCLFLHNSANVGSNPVGGAVRSVDSDLYVLNCTFYGNHANLDGGAIANTRGTALAENCIFWSDTPNEIADLAGGATTVRFSCVSGGWSADGVGNTSSDPQFVAPGSTPSDLRLDGSSPCVDSGDNSTLPPDIWDLDGDDDTDELLPVDLHGNRRVAAGTVDMGAFERPAASRPIADSGPDQTANEGGSVTLNGSGSYDPDDDPLTYEWTQLAGTPVALNLSDPEYPTFIAPEVALGGETLTFQLIVDDGELESEPDTVNVTVKNVNKAPVADAGEEQAVAEGTIVTLDGSGSYDPDAEPITYEWTQIDGPPVGITDPGTDTPTFVAPPVGPDGEALIFELTVSDGIDSALDAVTVLVENVNHPPVADAGLDQTTDENQPVTLDGSVSNDPDGDTLSYDWQQTGGPTVVLSDPTSANPSFTAPDLVNEISVTLVFELTVDDGYGGTAVDEVEVTVLDTNAPPACDLARASVDRLWPPNHKMHAISILGVTDPEDGDVLITIIDVTQDEPINGLGDGDTGPDAVLQGDSVLVRAERAGGGNGRVYHLTFEADDGVGGTCTGTVTVCVPRNKKDPCVDDGQVYGALAE